MPCAPDYEQVRKRTRPMVAKLRAKKAEEMNELFFREYKVKQAFDIIHHALEIFDSKKIAVAFSGGKDSLVALHLAMQVIESPLVIFNNTTVEFPETLRFVSELAGSWGIKIEVASPPRNLLRVVKKKGWATHENRWCCHFCKERPTMETMEQKEVDAEITGTIRTESIYRRSLTPFRPPKKDPSIFRINPIYDWNMQEVWAYIRKNNLPYNPLYEMGYRRIGCWCCPLNGPSHYRRLEKTHPKLYDMLSNFSPPHPFFNGGMISASRKKAGTDAEPEKSAPHLEA